jgi:NAD(P)H-hydrate epimerase
MSRLTGLSISEVQRDRVGIATSHARAWNAVVVLKGAFTIVADPGGKATLIPFATPALATAGTGDVLAGAIAGLLAQYRAASLKEGRRDAAAGVNDAYRAAQAGAYIHGLSGQLAGEEIGTAGVVAGDLITLLPEAIRILRGE